MFQTILTEVAIEKNQPEQVIQNYSLKKYRHSLQLVLDLILHMN